MLGLNGRPMFTTSSCSRTGCSRSTLCFREFCQTYRLVLRRQGQHVARALMITFLDFRWPTSNPGRSFRSSQEARIEPFQPYHHDGFPGINCRECGSILIAQDYCAICNAQRRSLYDDV